MWGQGFLTRDMEDMVMPGVMDDPALPEGIYLESFMFLSLLEVYQESGVKMGGTWRTFRVPDWKHGGHESS